ncbi:hypothetical protein [Rhizobacter sp. Root404]|jgi:hypothetical protein|uniref:hypothetical protein n=1 Tax=Rhizobacter sp. Root404 TaxID=1736528 RepID=UPI0006F78DEA|nr:hypothetical protein [Rhizobacter sp. Root404]KQW34286.1 hypothetical protein ASC76_23890 [Rhizobacter sp. Root404]
MQKLKGAVALACTCVLVACGGGGSNDTQPESVPHPEGRYDGYTTVNGRAATALILGADSYWVFYSAIGNPATIGGVVQGDISGVSVAAFTSANVRDFNYEGLGTAFGTATVYYTPRASVNATIGFTSGSTEGFVGAYNTTFAQTPSIETIAGTYTGTASTVVTGQQAGSGTINADGAFAGSAAGCNTTGTITPRAAANDSGSSSPRYGGNAYNVSITFGPAPCFYAGQTFTGVALYEADTKTLIAGATNAGRTDAMTFMGTKQ